MITKITQTHTHTHIYIYIYIYFSFVQEKQVDNETGQQEQTKTINNDM